MLVPEGDSTHTNSYSIGQPAKRCTGDPACIFPPTFDGLCRRHFFDSLCSYSWMGNSAAACAAGGEGPFTRRERAK
jgi:hypothetical protein